MWSEIVTGLLGGAIVGACVSFLVNSALLEISINGFFATLFGCSLLFMGVLILYRVNALNFNNSSDGRSPRKSMSSYFVMLFACLVILAGFCCFFLEKDWFHFISPVMKIPMYTLLGIALWFALTFSIMDLFNFLGQFIVSKLSKGRRIWQPLVSTPTQICVVLSVAVLLGLFFGLVFGTLDVEDDTSATFVKRSQEQTYTVPIGMTLCAFVGALNQAYLRPNIYAGVGQTDEYDPKSRAGYDDGI